MTLRALPTSTTKDSSRVRENDSRCIIHTNQFGKIVSITHLWKERNGREEQMKRNRGETRDVHKQLYTTLKMNIHRIGTNNDCTMDKHIWNGEIIWFCWHSSSTRPDRKGEGMRRCLIARTGITRQVHQQITQSTIQTNRQRMMRRKERD